MIDPVKQKEADLKSVMGTTQGRRVLWSLIDSCGIHNTTFFGNSKDTYNAGARLVGLTLHNDLKRICPDLLRKAEDEYIAFQKQLATQNKENQDA